MTVKKSNLTFLEPKDDYQFLRLVCQVALHDLEYALDMINKRLASKARNHRLHQVSYLAGLVSGAILLRMKPRALEKEIQDLLKTYGTRKNSEPLS